MYLNTISRNSRLCQRFTPSILVYRSAAGYYADRFRNKFYINETKLNDAIPIKGFSLIYSYPRIKYLQLLSAYNRNATFCTILCAAGLFHEALQQNLMEYKIVPVCLCIAAVTNFAVIFTARTIGSMYYNEETKEVLICYLTFWGNRKNIVVSERDIVPIRGPVGYWIPVVFRYFQILCPEKLLKLNVKSKVVFNKQKFSYITGLDS